MRKVAFLLSLGCAVSAWAGDCVGREGCALLPNVGAIKLGGDYAGHLQDVWFDGKALFWAHTLALVKTDLSGNVLTKADVDGHHAGLEVRDGKVFVAVCPMQWETGGRTLPGSRVTVNVYDAETLAPLESHVTDINDRAGSLAILDDGTFLVGCLRPPDITGTQVRFHHLDGDFRLIRSHVLDNVPAEFGIETIKRHGGCFYLCHYADAGSLCVKLDKDFREVARYNVDGACGLVFDGDNVWVGATWVDKNTGRWVSDLKRIAPPPGFLREHSPNAGMNMKHSLADDGEGG